MTTITLFFSIYATVLVAASFIHLVRLDYWWIRIWDFPHTQLTALTTAGLLGWLLFVSDFSWPAVLIPVGLLVAMIYQGWLIYPYTPLHKKQVRRISRRVAKDEVEPNTIRLMTANVYMENTRTPDVQALIARYQPDVVLLLETNLTWQKALAPIEDEYPYRVSCPLENTYGMLLYSRLPIQHHEIRFMVQDDIPSFYVQMTLPSGQLVHFYGVHPMPPSPTEHYRSTERDAELLLVGKEARRRDEPIIVAGDLNDVAWSHTTRLFQRVSGLFDPRIGRGLYSTFHAHYFFLRWPLDHVFVSHHFQLQRLRRLPNCGSDHFPILVSLVYRPTRAQKETIPQPEHDDLHEAKDIIERAKG
ncbi:endonuclease/exonuclease/phosphatase family protein [Spirosoma montaniterrae]|uniref:Endonuclease n=1 Tax=Spirosoma montaniterrae TaxID=1178516 RepID=A0A1P9WT58_9BACT|nr:endonuclease/exonuclease/phosphatase family protein [Spirosoma montaniterrae]AQG78576.1 endonuclease [Spirosoma montaniterrae]